MTAKPTYLRNRTAAEEMIQALRSAGRLELIDSARVATFQSLADAVDADMTNASLWREYRAAEESLREVHDDNDSELSDLLRDLSSEMGNTPPPGPRDPWP